MQPLHVLLPLLVSIATAAPSVNWVPADLPPPPATGPVLCPGAFLTPAQGQAVLDAALVQFPDRATWQAYVDHARNRIQEGAGLKPWPKRTLLHPISRARRTYDGYSVENVAFESVPGYFVGGNLYRPLHGQAPYPVVLSTHGHVATHESPGDDDRPGRFVHVMQARNATLARLGAVVLAIEMVGYGDSIAAVGSAAHKTSFVQSLQIWNSIRALDFLLALDGTDPTRVAVSGESGGGTQTFLLTALDQRVTLAAPVVMVSSYFFGGCPCESGQPVHRSADHFVSNAMIASFAAPRPMLVVSDGADWTQHVPETEFPFLQKIYGYYGAATNVANVHLPMEKHDYGPSKRAAVYRFIAEKFGLSLAPALDAAGQIDESHVTIEPPGPMHSFNAEFPLPASALKDIAAVERTLHQLQQ
ncbi:MAG: acetylxylan esterase [Opitutus sp.]|nr:acetylxylan esterase [Opitutus sp.]